MNPKPIVKSTQPDSDFPDYIFYKFDSLQPGNGFIIHEDNDPHSIYSQMLKEKGDSFSWEYLATGPKKWCIKISKRAKDDYKETLGEMAAADYRKALIFKKYGLDYSFKGKRTLLEACAEKNISTKNVKRELNASGQQSLVYTVNYNSWELDYLADFITANHHPYTRKTLLCIADELQLNANVINQNYLYLLPLVNAFNLLNTAMQALMQEEEQVLFPYIRFLAHVTKGKINANSLPSGSVREQISKIESEQQKVGEQVDYICNFTSNYTMPHIEHSFYIKVLGWLNEFHNDLHQHAHIENNILYRKALMLEEEYITNLQACSIAPEKSRSDNDRRSSLL